METLKAQREEEEDKREKEMYSRERSLEQMEVLESQDKRYVAIELRRMVRMRAAQDVLRSKRDIAMNTKMETLKNIDLVAAEKTNILRYACVQHLFRFMYIYIYMCV